MGIHDYSTALVTGASSGIGAACTRAFRNAGLRVVAVARREDRLAALAEETGCELLVLDLKDTNGIYEALGGLEVDILVNNAGLGRGFEGFLASSVNEIEEMIDVNVTAAVHVTRAVLGGMVERKRGHLVQLSSIAALYPVGFPVYGASKGALHQFSRNIRMELPGSRVRQTEICPGRIATEFFDTAFKDATDKDAFMAGFEALKAEDIAEAILYAVSTPLHVNVSLIELTPSQQAPGGFVIDRQES